MQVENADVVFGIFIVYVRSKDWRKSFMFHGLIIVLELSTEQARRTLHMQVETADAVFGIFFIVYVRSKDSYCLDMVI